MNIVAVFNSNPGRGFWPYTAAHITSLRNQLARVGHALTVIGDDVPLHHQPAFAGWWSKMLVYAPEYAHLRPMLALDLDSIVLRPLDNLLQLDAKRLWLIRKFLSREHEPEMGVCSVPDAPISDAIWQAALTNDKQRPPGDLIGRFDFSFMTDVARIYSYKKHATKAPPPDAQIICYHGTPKPPDVKGWALDWWQTSLNSPTKN